MRELSPALDARGQARDIWGDRNQVSALRHDQCFEASRAHTRAPRAAGQGITMAGKAKSELPPLAPKCPGKPDGKRYRAQYGVIAVCPNEVSQRALYEGLKALQGVRLKVVVT
jgi:hypothetical protein